QAERDYALRQRDEAAAARAEAERQQRHARALLHKALAAVDRLTQVTPERLAQAAAALTPEGRPRLQDAVELCSGFLPAAGDDPAGRQEAGQTHSRLALLHILLGQLPQAQEPVRQALAIQEKLAADFPGRDDYQYDLARSRLVRGHLALMGNRLA